MKKKKKKRMVSMATVNVILEHGGVYIYEIVHASTIAYPRPLNVVSF